VIGARPAAGAERLGPDEFAKLFGTTVDALPPACHTLAAAHDFRYRVLDAAEEAALLADVDARIAAGTFSVAGRAGKARWERGWGENLTAFRTAGDPAALVPRYIRDGQPLRLFRRYVLPFDARFERHWYGVFRRWLFATHFADVGAVFEFGCGSGHNLAALATLFPGMRLVGLDWSVAARDLACELARRHGHRIEGRLFDFFAPDVALGLPADAAVLTVGALEQTGRDWGPFLDWLLRRRPRLVVHVEPILEWYDPDDVVDLAAIRFHRARGYWEGYPARLDALASEGRIEILARKRSYFGSLYLEGYSQLVWRPV
jgi:SAM-dependent methyltransferase